MSYYIENSRQWVFPTVQEFWESNLKGRPPGPHAMIDKDYGFWGKLSKGLTGDAIEALKSYGNNIDADILALCITVEQVHSEGREHNFRRLSNPPPRTGKFDRFMDEVESLAKNSGLQLILIDKVATEFLRDKFLRRGYEVIEYGWRDNPDYIIDIQ